MARRLVACLLMCGGGIGAGWRWRWRWWRVCGERGVARFLYLYEVDLLMVDKP